MQARALLPVFARDKVRHLPTAQPTTVWAVFLAKGESLPDDEELIELIRKLHEQDKPVPITWEMQAVCESYGAAEVACDKIMEMKGTHIHDHLQIVPFMLNAILPRGRFHLADQTFGPPKHDYLVISREKYEEEQCLLRELIETLRTGS